jgi:hypothetical protein
MRARRARRDEGGEDGMGGGGGRREGRGGGLISKGVKGLASGVGLVSESYKAHKEGKEEKKRDEEERGSGFETRQEIEGSSRQEIPYRGKDEGIDVPSIDGPPPAYDAPSYSSGQGSYSQGQSSKNRQQRYLDEKPGGQQYGDERTGSPHYQNERTGPGQYPDEKTSHNPYRDAMSGSSQYRDERPGHSQYQGEGASRSQYQDERLAPSQYQDEKSDHGLSPNPAGNDEVENDLEDEWALDDAQDELTRDPLRENAAPPSEDEFIRNHPPPRYSEQTPTPRLPMPVVLPQRRPKDRSRGFIRAYAPLLENCGIDQATWLEFLDSFERNSAASPWIKAVNMAGLATIPLPMGIGLAVGYAIQQGVKVATEVHARAQ